MEIAAAVTGITDVAARIGSKLWSLSVAWRDAPEDLYRLRDDLARTHQFFGEINEGCLDSHQASLGRQKETPVGQSELQRLLGDGTNILRRIEAIIDKVVHLSGQGHRELGKRGKLYWIGIARKEIVSLKKELREVRGAICRYLIAQNVITSIEIHASIDQSRDEINEYVNKTLAVAHTRINQTIQASQGHTLAYVDSRWRNVESNIVTRVKRSMTDEFAKQRQAEPKPPQYSTKAIMGASNISQAPSSLRRASRCNRKCLCLCHTVSTYSWTLGSLINGLRAPAGAITVGYQSRTSQACTTTDCQDDQSVKTFYDLLAIIYIPDWLARIAVSVFLSSNLNGSPQLNIRLINRRFVTKSSLIHDLVVGDVEKIKHALRKGLSSVNDHWDGIGSLLFLAIHSRNTTMIKFLIQAGADPFQLDGPSGDLSPVGSVFHRSLADDPLAKEAATLFPISKYIDEAEYSPLHLAVLGFLHIDLAKALQTPEYLLCINQLSVDRMTPLHFAVSKGDVYATKLLLRSGADPDAVGVYGRTPLHLACRYGHDQVVHLLLNAGADPRVWDQQGMSPMPYATIPSERPDQAIRCVSMLLEYGADINCKSALNCTPLSNCIGQRGSMRVIEFLVRNGARMNDRDNHGNNVLIMAIVARRPEVAKFLLEQGVDYKNLSNNRWSLLHFMANWADIETINMFAQWKLRGVSTALKDCDGRTALRVFNEQVPPPSPELREAFDALLDSVEGLESNATLEEPADDGDWSDEEDVFVDALETLAD